jgi:hypothetical protein
MSYVLVDSCPTPRKLAPVLKRIKQRTGCVYQSIYRGPDVEGLLHRVGKHSQRELYQMFLAGRGNPANRPGQSTHELRSDGVAYVGPVGRRLRWWQVGIDVDDAHVQAFIRQAAREGFHAAITYPGSRSEYHHINFRKAPVVAFPTLKRGARGPRVVVYSRRLATLGFLDHGRLHFDVKMESAVKEFQRRSQQKVDGRIGAQTAHQITVNVRQHNQNRKKK